MLVVAFANGLPKIGPESGSCEIADYSLGNVQKMFLTVLNIFTNLEKVDCD